MTDKIQLWYKEALNVTKEFKVKGISFIIYKGFKIAKYDSGFYLLQDVREDDFYSEVIDSEYKMIVEKGFVKAVDEINHKLNIKRVRDYTKQVEFLYFKRKKAKVNLKKDIRLNKKRIKLANKNIDILVDQMFLFKTRINQFNNKYKLENE